MTSDLGIRSHLPFCTLMKIVKKTDRSDDEKLTDIINAAYRGLGGERRWTTEAHLVHGDRIRLQDLQAMIEEGDIELYVGYLDEQPVGCIAVKRRGPVTEFGTFAVDPDLHGLGYGKTLLQFAEGIARHYSDAFQVCVVSRNADLIAFYRRRGYQETGAKLAYPVGHNVGTPADEDLDLIVLSKGAR